MLNRSIVLKIIVIFISFCVFPLFVFSYIYFIDYRSANELRFKQDLSTIVHEKSKVLGLTFEQAENEVENLGIVSENFFATNSRSSSQTSFPLVVQEQKSSSDLYIPKNNTINSMVQSDIRVLNQLDKQLFIASQHTKNRGWIYVITQNNLMKIYPKANLNYFGEDHNFSQDVYYMQANAENNPQKKVRWTEPYIDWLGNSWTITATFPIYVHNKFYGVSGIDIHLDAVKKIVANEYFEKRGFSFLIDAKGNILYHPNVGKEATASGATLTKNIMTEPFSDAYKKAIQSMLVRDSGTVIYSDDSMQVRRIISYKRVMETGWILGVETDLDFYNSDTPVYSSLLINIMLPTVILAMVMGICLFLKISKPIQVLVKIVEGYIKGEYHVIPPTDRKDEIGILQNKFNEMIRDINDSTSDLIEKNKEIVAIFNSFSGVVYISDHNYNLELINNSRLPFMNKGESFPCNETKQDGELTRNFSDDLYGSHKGYSDTRLRLRHCYEEIFGLKTPCEFCPREPNSSKSRQSKSEHQIYNHILSFSATAITDNGSENSKWVIYIDDMTERKLIQKSIYQKEKLIKIGQIFAGVSHELRGPMATLRGARYLSSLIVDNDLPESEAKEELSKNLANIDECIDQSEKIIINLLDFTRQDDANNQETDINKIIKQILILYNNDFGKFKISVEQLLETQPLFTRVDREALKTIFSNLIYNAIQAMPAQEPLLIVQTRLNADAFIQIDIVDNGCGIDKSIINILYEPFVTAQKKGGTGLGLWIVQMQLKAIGGKINFLTSERGTTFTVYIPSAGRGYNVTSKGSKSIETE